MLGVKGAGKTTLLRIHVGESKSGTGAFEFGYEVKLGYFAQEHDSHDPPGRGCRVVYLDWSRHSGEPRHRICGEIGTDQSAANAWWTCGLPQQSVA